MNRFLLFVCSFLLWQAAQANPSVVFHHKVFYVPGEGTLVETYLDFHGKSVTMSLNEDGYLQGLLEIVMIFKDGENIVSYDKKMLQTPEMLPESIVDFIDVQRFMVPPGDYTFELEITDLNDTEGETVMHTQNLTVPKAGKNLFFSDIEMVSAYKKTTEPNVYSKSGYDLLPMVSDDYAGAAVNELMLYGELYNSDQMGADEMFLMVTYVADAESGEPLPETQKFERKKVGTVVPVLSKIDISEVETGDYKLVLEARDRDNEVLASRAHAFSRNKSLAKVDYENMDQEKVMTSWVGVYDDKAELYDHLQSLRPIADGEERFNLENTFADFYETELPILQRYFLAFWEKRNSGDSEAAWLEYKQHVDIAQRNYGTRNRRGYETDRGRVYLQYGPPVDITDRANEPSSYPYEIWRYYKADRWNNVRFVFYDPDLTGRDYTLLHCERIPGELNNPQWRLLLEQRNTPMNNVDRRQGNEHFGGRIDDFFDNPR